MTKPVTEESVVEELNSLLEDTRKDIDDVRAELKDALGESADKAIGTVVTRLGLRLANLEGRYDLYKTVDYRLHDHAHHDVAYEDRQRRTYYLLVNRLAQTPTEDLVNHAAQAHQEGFRLAFRDVVNWLVVD